MKKVEKLEKRKLFAMEVVVWDASDWFNGANANTHYTCYHLYATEEVARDAARNLYFSKEIYNSCRIVSAELSEEDILEIASYYGIETIEDFDEALAEPYSTIPRHKNYGEEVKDAIASEIFSNTHFLHTEEVEDVECANYDFDKSLEGCILVFWSWHRYIGYARKFIEVRYACSEDKGSMLAHADKVFCSQCDVLLTAEEVSASADIQESIREALEESHWKWTNPSFVESSINNFVL